MNAKDWMKFVVALIIPACGIQIAGEAWRFHTAKVV
jgi:uncharacterized membrane protein YqaE (UPF0057 family)